MPLKQASTSLCLGTRRKLAQTDTSTADPNPRIGECSRHRLGGNRRARCMKTFCTARNGNGLPKFAANQNLNTGNPERWIESLLFFGLNNEFIGLREKIPADAPAADWEKFLDEEITPRFPAGYTVLEAEGFKQDIETGLTVREGTRVLLVVHPDRPEPDERLESLRTEWCRRYNQESVLRVDIPVVARF